MYIIQKEREDGKILTLTRVERKGRKGKEGSFALNYFGIFLSIHPSLGKKELKSCFLNI